MLFQDMNLIKIPYAPKNKYEDLFEALGWFVFLGLLTTTLRATVVRALIIGQSDADAFVSKTT